jgi:hypothetical protein
MERLFFLLQKFGPDFFLLFFLKEKKEERETEINTLLSPFK